MSHSTINASISTTIVRSWQSYREEVTKRLEPHFRRPETRQRVKSYLDGLLSNIQRKNSWQLAEMAGNSTPYGLQHLLSRAVWSADAVRDELFAYVAEYLGDPEGVVVIDETGCPKQGVHSAGVAQQYSSALGKMGNCQVGLFLTYASLWGYTLLDRELFLPKVWANDSARLQKVGLSSDTTFETKPQLAKRMLERMRIARMPAAWVLGDSHYGHSRELRTWLEEQNLYYVLEVRRNTTFWTGNNHWCSGKLQALSIDLNTSHDLF